MALKKIASSLACIGLMAATAGSAHAGYAVLDGWGMSFTDASNTAYSYNNIGRLNLVSGSASVQQEVNGSGTPFVGADFYESGAIYSISYTTESTVGVNDVGAPVLIQPGLTISFGPVTGHVTTLNANGSFNYVFDSGLFNISVGAKTLASGSIVGIGGIINDTSIVGGVTGTSTLLALLSTLTDFTFYDDGNDITSDVLAGDVLFEATTNNTVGPEGITTGACTLVTGTNCRNFNVSSAGDAYLVRDIPEPASIALLGLGLLGVGAMRRRSK